MRPIRPRTKPRANRLKGQDLEALRLACFMRDKGKCVRCGVKLNYIKRFQNDPQAYDMAHIRNKRMFGDVLENVESLCHAEHSRYHSYGPSMEKPVLAKERAS